MSETLGELLAIAFFILIPFALVWWNKRKGAKAEVNAGKPADEPGGK